MKFSRIISSVLTLVLLVQFFSWTSVAASTSTPGVTINDEEKNLLIDDLFAQRLHLEHDYDSNLDEINQIDQQLLQLGVEMLSTETVARLFDSDGIAPLWEPVSTNTVQWTSRKLITTYRGYHFEVQIIEGVPISSNSSLRKNYANVTYRAEGILAGLANAAIIVGESIAPNFLSSKLSAGVSFLSMLSDVNEALAESLSTSTVLERVEGAAVISFSGHMKYIHVKPYQTSDTYQGVYYIGNSVSCIISTISVVDILVNGNLVTYHGVSANVEDVLQSQYYDDYSKAVANYWEYNYNNNRNIIQDYTEYSLNLKVLGTTDFYWLPTAIHPNTTD